MSSEFTVRQLTAYLNGICKRFNLDPDRVRVLVNGEEAANVAYASLEFMNDGAMVEYCEAGQHLRPNKGTFIWSDKLGSKSEEAEFYRTVYIAITQL